MSITRIFKLKRKHFQLCITISIILTAVIKLIYDMESFHKKTILDSGLIDVEKIEILIETNINKETVIKTITIKISNFYYKEILNKMRGFIKKFKVNTNNVKKGYEIENYDGFEGVLKVENYIKKQNKDERIYTGFDNEEIYMKINKIGNIKDINFVKKDEIINTKDDTAFQISKNSILGTDCLLRIIDIIDFLLTGDVYEKNIVFIGDLLIYIKILKAVSDNVLKLIHNKSIELVNSMQNNVNVLVDRSKKICDTFIEMYITDKNVRKYKRAYLGNNYDKQKKNKELKKIRILSKYVGESQRTYKMELRNLKHNTQVLIDNQ